MGLRGPPPKPTAIKRLEGNPSGRPLNKREPMPSPLLAIDPPDTLPEAGKTIWRQLSGELIRIGLLTSIDTNAFHRYVKYLLEYHEADQKIGDQLVIAIRYPESEGGGVKYLMQNPYLSIRNTAADKLLKLEQQFGMSPAARARMVGLLDGKGVHDEPDPYGD